MKHRAAAPRTPCPYVASRVSSMTVANRFGPCAHFTQCRMFRITDQCGCLDTAFLPRIQSSYSTSIVPSHCFNSSPDIDKVGQFPVTARQRVGHRGLPHPGLGDGDRRGRVEQTPGRPGLSRVQILVFTAACTARTGRTPPHGSPGSWSSYRFPGRAPASRRTHAPSLAAGSGRRSCP